jgi:hypothetical protein
MSKYTNVVFDLAMWILKTLWHVCVSFIGYIMLTKSLPCKCAALTGMPYYFRVFKYFEFISLIWKGP